MKQNNPQSAAGHSGSCALIPARFASKRLPGKPLLSLGAISLIERTYRNAAAMELFDEIIVLTDDRRIFKHVEGFGGKALMTGVCKSGTMRIAQAVQEQDLAPSCPLIINLQGDEPFVPKEVILALLQLMNRYPQTSIGTCAVPASEADFAKNSVVKCVFNQTGDALYFSRASIPGRKEGAPSRSVKRLFRYRHVGVYAYRRPFLPIYAQLAETPLQILEDLEQLKVLEHGYGMKIATCEIDCPPGVDTEEDLEQARELIKRHDPLK